MTTRLRAGLCVVAAVSLSLGALASAHAQARVDAAGASAEVSTDGGATWGPLTVGTVLQTSNRVRASASTTIELTRTTGCKNKFTVHWRQDGAVAHYVGRLFGSPIPILSPGDFWEIGDLDFTTFEGAFCELSDHCGVITPTAVAVPTVTSDAAQSTYTVSHDSGTGTTLMFNRPGSFSTLATWTLAAPEPVLNVLAPGQAATYLPDGSFNPFLFCDTDRDGDVDRQDVQAIFAARRTTTTLGDPRDADTDTTITVNDARVCSLCVEAEPEEIGVTVEVVEVFPASGAKVTVPGRCRVTAVARTAGGTETGRASGSPTDGTAVMVTVKGAGGGGIFFENGDTLTVTVSCPCFQEEVREFVFRNGRFLERL